ncbi:MAG: acyltransferase domain-containing protein [Pseudomonadota bacterium]|nr:acyltransferase domain-containing protein [Pseudomonadota bacterium]
MPTHSKTAFLFTGQGAQWEHMGYALSISIPHIKSKLQFCIDYLQKKYSIDLQSVIEKSATSCDIHQTLYTQPALVMFEIACANFLIEQGIKADYVIGHSVGEIAASHIAGFYTLENTLDLIANRSQLMQSLPKQGSMLACICDLNTVKVLLNSNPTYSQDIQIAGINSPKQTIVSGKSTSLDQFSQKLKDSGIKTIPLQVSHAFHSKLMQPILESFHKKTKKLSILKQKEYPTLLLNQFGEEATALNLTSDYWCQQIIQPVNFIACIENAYKCGVRKFIEVGPQPILTKLSQKILSQEQDVVFAYCSDAKNPVKCLQQTLSLHNLSANIEHV